MRKLMGIALLLLSTTADAGSRTLLGEQCSIELPQDQHWTEAEHWAWAKICTGEIADLSHRDAKNPKEETVGSCNPVHLRGEVPRHRVISARFLRLILTQPEYIHALSQKTIGLACAQVTGHLTLSSENIEPALSITRSQIIGRFSAQMSSFRRHVNFSESTFESRVLLGSSYFLAGLTLGRTPEAGLHVNDVSYQPTHFKQGLNLKHADIRFQLTLTTTIVEGDFVASGLHVDGRLTVHESSRFDYVLLTDAKISGSVLLRGSTIRGDFVFEHAEIGGALSLNGSTIQGHFLLRRAEVGGIVSFGQGMTIKKSVQLTSTTVGQSVNITESSFWGSFSGEAMSVGKSVSLGPDSLFQDVTLEHANIRDNLSLSNGSFLASLYLSNATIGGELQLSRSNGDSIAWGEDSWMIDLRNATVGTLQSTIDAWKRADGSWVTTDLTGFSYVNLGGSGAKSHKVGTNMAHADPDALIAWIEQSQLRPDRIFDPHPYTQLARALDDRGASEAAKAVRYARFEHKRRAATTSKPAKIWLLVKKCAVGYGVYTYKLSFWFAALVCLGIALAYKSRASALNSFGAKFWYSLENALPLVELKESHKNLDHGQGLVEGYFHFQKVVGFVMASMLVGTLTLLGGD